MKLIVGLGNPGLFYADNRHNIGFLCINHFAVSRKIKFDKKLGQARTGTGEIDGIPVLLAKPQTYMNASGQAVARLIERFDLGMDDLTVIHDDLDLPVGRIRIRQGGSSGGHKGIESIIATTGSPDFIRIRVGIGRPAASGEQEVIDHVLSGFTAAEKKIIEQVVPCVGEAILAILTEGLAAAMNKYNQSTQPGT